MTSETENESAGADGNESVAGGPPCWIVGFDGSHHSSQALEWAATRAAEQGALLDVISAWMYPHADSIPPMDDDDLPSAERAWADAEQSLIYSVDQLRDKFGVVSRRRAVIGPASAVLLDAVEEADLAVVGNRGRGGFARLVLGSVSQNLANRSPKPTIVVPEFADPAALGRMVVGVDRSPGAFSALRWAHDFAPADCEIRVVSVWKGFGLTGVGIDSATTATLRESAQEDLERMLRKLEAELGVPNRFTRVFETGHPGKALVRHGADADMVVVGTRGESEAIAPILGSVSMWLVHHLPCPTAVVPLPATA